jgi:uncharacterized membrane-anchored protein YhcB (DUF1043 family)
MRPEPPLSSITRRMDQVEDELQQLAAEFEQVKQQLQADAALLSRLQESYQQVQEHLADSESHDAITTEMLLSLISPLENSLILLGQALAREA